MKNKFKLGLILFFSQFYSNSFALEQEVKQWVAINHEQAFGCEKKYLAFIYSQLRLVDEDRPWQAGLIEGGLGYKLADHHTIWVGYRWSGHDPFNQFFQENRLFQQIILQKKTDAEHRLIFRTRLEEITRGNTGQIALRLRQRAALEINHAWFQHALPFFYDEVFFQLNHPDYVPKTTLGENRLFLGFNLMCAKNSWWEIGYINQYRIATPSQTENLMGHIFSVTYNIN